MILKATFESNLNSRITLWCKHLSQELIAPKRQSHMCNRLNYFIPRRADVLVLYSDVTGCKTTQSLVESMRMIASHMHRWHEIQGTLNTFQANFYYLDRCDRYRRGIGLSTVLSME